MVPEELLPQLILQIRNREWLLGDGGRFFRERGRSNSERDGGARAGRGKGGCSSTAWNHAGSRFKYPALSRREACLCT